MIKAYTIGTFNCLFMYKTTYIVKHKGNIYIDQFTTTNGKCQKGYKIFKNHFLSSYMRDFSE